MQLSATSNKAGTNLMLSSSCLRLSCGTHLSEGRLFSRHLSSLMSGDTLSNLTLCSTLVPSMGTYTHVHIQSLFPERIMLVLASLLLPTLPPLPGIPALPLLHVGSDVLVLRLVRNRRPAGSLTHALHDRAGVTCLLVCLSHLFTGIRGKKLSSPNFLSHVYQHLLITVKMCADFRFFTMVASHRGHRTELHLH